MTDKIILTLRGKIKKGLYEEFFTLIQNELINQELINKIRIFEARLNRIENNYLLGFSTNEEKNKEYNLINYGLLKLLTQIETNGSEETENEAVLSDSEINPIVFKKGSILNDIINVKNNLLQSNEFELFLVILNLLSRVETEFYESISEKVSRRNKTLNNLSIKEGNLITGLVRIREHSILNKTTLENYSSTIIELLKYDFKNCFRLFEHKHQVGLIFKTEESTLKYKQRATLALISYLIFILIYVLERLGSYSSFIKDEVNSINKCIQKELIDYLQELRPSYLTDHIFDDYSKANGNFEVEYSIFGITVENIKHVESYKEYDEINYDYRNVFRFSLAFISEVSRGLLFNKLND